MFAPAEWEPDVPEQTAVFPRVKRRKAKVTQATAEPVFPNIKEKKNDTQNAYVENVKSPIVVLKSKHPTRKTKLVRDVVGDGDNEPKKKKQKRVKEIHNFVDQPAEITDDLEKPDETIIANKKKEMYKAVKSTEIEKMLFSDHTKLRNKQRKQKMLETVASNKSENKVSNNTRKQKKNEKNKNILQSNFIGASIKPDTKQSNEETIKIKMPEIMTLNKAENKVLHNTINQKKKEKIKNVLQSNLIRTSIKASGFSLHERMTKRLKAAHFRFLNEKLYLSEGKDAKELFKNDPTSFKIYHEGFQQQVKSWPINPLDIIIKQISKLPKETKVADMGCGEGTLAKRVPQRVRSFDLVSSAEGVEECDMAHTPLLAGEMDIAVYCLALMGTNLKDYLIEANRILKVGGIMKIAEVESRFQDVNEFIRCVECYGFQVTHIDDSRNVFYFLDFKKLRDLGSKRNKLPFITLEPCLYKKR